MKISKKDAISLLSPAGIYVEEDKRLPNGSGDQVRWSNGAIVNFFNTGKIHIQGKDTDHVKAILEKADAIEGIPISNRVFVVYGENADAKSQLESLLRRWGLEPTELSQIPTGGKTVVDKLENYCENICFGIVLATPDDEGYHREYPDEKCYRAWQDIMLEMGMLLTRLGRKRVAVLVRDKANTELPSDIYGLMVFTFNENVEEIEVYLEKEIRAAGYNITV